MLILNDCINQRSIGRILTNTDDTVGCLSTELSKNCSSAGVRYNSSAADNQHCSNKDIVLDNVSFGVGDEEKKLLSQGHSELGPYGIPGILFKRLALALTLPMCLLFHQSLHQCAIPVMWRAANITPCTKERES